MPPVGFEPWALAGERPQTYALDRAATGTGAEIVKVLFFQEKKLFLFQAIRRLKVTINNLWKLIWQLVIGLYSSPNIVRVIKPRRKMSGTCGPYGGRERSVEGAGGETRGEETAGETQA